MRAEIVVFDGVDELDAIGPYRVLAGARGAGAKLDLALVALDDVSHVIAQQGLGIGVDRQLAEPPDLLIVPGGGWAARAERGAWGEAQRGALPAVIARIHAAGTMLATVCTGAMLAAAAGLMRGRHATTHRSALPELREAGAELIAARVVDDGDIISTGGVTSGLDLALWLVERYYDSRIAAKVEQNLEYERRGVVWQRSRPLPPDEMTLTRRLV